MIALNKNSILAVFFLFAPFLLCAQEAEPGAVTNSTENPKSWDVFFTLGPSVYVNTGSKKTSAPSPVSFTPGIGLDFFNGKALGLQTSLSFFSTYSLWDGKNARPAEVENREASTINFLLDIDGTKKFALDKNIFELSLGASFLIRYGFLSNGVNGDEAGTTSGKTVKDDIDSINDWYYTGMNFLYPNVGFSWLRDFEGRWNAGLFLKYYVPLGALTDGRGMDTSIISFGVKALRK